MPYSEHSHNTPASAGRVVVIDDNADLRHMLALALETSGFDVVTAATEIDLQRVLLHTLPDALLIDMQSSEALGLRLLKRIRNRLSLRGVPILFLAGCEADDFRQHAMRMGADWFGLRPLGMLELQTQVTELVQRKRRSDQRAAHRKHVS
jgi:DNA-binding response OmpR family regulator